MHHHIQTTITDHINLLTFSSKPHERDLAHYLQLLLDFYLNHPDPYNTISNAEEAIYRHEDYRDYACYGYFNYTGFSCDIPLHDRQCDSCPALTACQIATKLK